MGSQGFRSQQAADPSQSAAPPAQLAASAGTSNQARQEQIRQLLAAHKADYETAQQVCGELGELSTDERFIYGLRAEINAAGTADVSPGMIAAILADENRRRDTWDAVQDIEAGFIIWYEGLVERFEVAAWGATTGKSVETQTFGAAQMQPQVVQELVDGGYLSTPANWTGDELDRSLELLTDDAQAPTLVAARLQQTVDHWRAGGVDISGRPEILGTLYSIGLHSSAGVHPDPHPNQRGTAIAATIPRLECVLAMP